VVRLAKIVRDGSIVGGEACEDAWHGSAGMCFRLQYILVNRSYQKRHGKEPCLFDSYACTRMFSKRKTSSGTPMPSHPLQPSRFQYSHAKPSSTAFKVTVLPCQAIFYSLQGYSTPRLRQSSSSIKFPASF